MTQDIKITLPKLGESILSATVVQWFKKEGDHVEEDEPLLEVTTDKVNSEIPSTSSGILKEIVAHPDQEIEVGATLAVISSSKDGKSSQQAVSEETEKPANKSTSRDSSFLSPAVLRLAREKGISLGELEKINGTGGGGRVSKKDLESYLSQKGSLAKSSKSSDLGNVEKVKMSTMRKAIADNMVKSFYEAPHASLITEVDVTKIVDEIKGRKEAFLKEHGFKLTITTFIAKAIAEAVKEFPLINSSLDSDTIVVKRFVNLGIAVSVDQGIMVPVIKNCQSRSLEEIAEGVARLSQKARSQELTVQDTKEGTITMTNFGMSGALIGIPIIRFPEVAIIGIGAITKRVVAFDDDSFGVRSIMHVSLTFDHRVIDGMYGCGFLSALKKHVEN
ncbi:branched-chain alpha-keto acid dehydrogenase subunit E2 [Candidatus Aerophobetes bacterium]|uniref:Dihydrolipoamide acetyltransferase component of pyruvate dehydrogenase complex n=1 Tax=Aerophobetes bacterium TaxID=2030807 RepID=A0A2A4YD08_UNCAE|nr:MAG: branched-chain alpha-keto acid dehydrogenase subunit E2 [Candidatus Aerophobetes bacterium]